MGAQHASWQFNDSLSPSTSGTEFVHLFYTFHWILSLLHYEKKAVGSRGRRHKSHKHNANEVGVIRRAQAEQRSHQQMLSRIKRITWAAMDARRILCCGPSTQNALCLAYHVAHSLTNFPSHCSELCLLVGLPWPSCFQLPLPLHPLFSGSSLLCSALSPPHPIALITG